MKLFNRELGSGEALIILHGLFGSSDNWQSLAKVYAEKYRVILIDQRNHGRSPRALSNSYEDMAADLLELMDDLDITSAHLLGHSMGGKTVMRFAQLYPQRVKSLMVSDIAPIAYPPHHLDVLKAFHAINLNELQSRKDAEDIVAIHLPDPAVALFILKNLYRDENQRFAWRVNLPVLEAEMPKILEALPLEKVNLPCIFFRGQRSGYINFETIPLIKAQFPQAVVETINDSSHWIHAENPVEFSERLLHFLDSLKP
jgi:pimeloyl-ACP methyl ester carboxylesterase